MSDKSGEDGMDDDFNKIDWRWSKLDPTFFGLHASVLLTLPILIVSVWIFGSTHHYNILKFIIFLCAIYVGFLIHIARRSFTPIEYIKYCFYRFIINGEWIVRRW